MHRLFLLLLGCCCFSSILPAQSFPSEEPISPQALSPQTGPRHARALWDLEFVYNLSDSTQGDRSMAAAYYFAPTDEFWVSRWNTDTLYRLDRNGSLIQEFTLSGLSGTRSFTSDGTYLYAGNATGIIYRIDPTTQQLAPPHINLNTSITARHCSYDPNADNGNGGFWIGNFSTDIVLVDLAGDVLATIPQGIHQLTGMYGSALDTSSAGGPYLWVFHRGGTNDTQLSQLRLSNGNFTGLYRDVRPDLGTMMMGGVAGGLFISYDYYGNRPIIGGVIQSGALDNLLFAYELDDPIGAPVDLEITQGNTSTGYSAIPSSQIGSIRFTTNVSNQGVQTVDTAFLDYSIQFGGNTVWSDTQRDLGLLVGFTEPLQSQPYTPNLGLGRYRFSAIARPGQNQADQNTSNDTLRFDIEVTDSIMARAQPPYANNGYTVSNNLSAYAACNYELFRSDVLSGIQISVVSPTPGDTTYAMLFSVDANGEPQQRLDQGPAVLLQSGVEDYFLPFSSLQSLDAGTYCFAVYEEADAGIGLKQSATLYTPGVNYFYRNNNWSASGIPTARAINPVFSTPLTTTVEAEQLGLQIAPNPSSDYLQLQWEEAPQEELPIRIIGSDGRLWRQLRLPPNQRQIEVSALPTGIYFLEIHREGRRKTYRFVKQ